MMIIFVLDEPWVTFPGSTTTEIKAKKKKKRVNIVKISK